MLFTAFSKTLIQLLIAAFLYGSSWLPAKVRKLLCTSHYFWVVISVMNFYCFLLLDINQNIKEMDFTSGTKSIQTFNGFALPSKHGQCTEYQLPGR